MLLAVLLAILLGFLQTSQAAQEDDTNIFLDLGREHCATEIAFATFERTDEDELVTNALPPYVTYSAFQFETAEQAVAALEDAPVLVAETFSDEPDISESEDFDRIANQVPTEDYGDASLAYVMTLPVDDDELEVLAVDLLGIVENDQLLLILVFSGTGTTRPVGPAVTLETIPPFAEDLDEEWDGTGDLEESIPDNEQLPIGWEKREVTIEDPPSC
ncbi:MAG: hypothetical protein M3173_00545 [Chloroflexota bacterium]|nr:hypothetical protein [Chloroflexota bacterium]